ncbi:hypothetical protein G7Y79_00007g021350 [Physcia stellaris]|nr:hypothetical protein G7Y79_00007g021350 [Physcia stellaris]
MKLTIKDLKQQKFVIEAEPSETIGQVKEKISTEKGWEASQQKLIYSGKILQDANTVESYMIEEKGFIVCMVSKPKAAPASSTAPTSSKPPSTPAAPITAQTPAAPAAPAPASNTTTSDVPATPTPAPSAAATTEGANFNDPSALTLGAQRDEAITNLLGMGFERAAIDRAMRAAYFNPDRAVQFLIDGIPEDIQQEQQQAAPRGGPRTPAATTQTPTAAPATGTTPATGDAPADTDAPINLFEAAAQANRGGAGTTGGSTQRSAGRAAVTEAARGLNAAAGGRAGGAAGNLDFLRQNPQFQQLRQIVQTQPQMLEPILQQVGAGNPQLAALIAENPDQFLQLLAEDTEGDTPLPPGAQEISVTEDERAAIERLCLLGFERDLVIQAYFACDKNEELAANFLFDQPDDGDE